ncbi:MAG: hypothetical protein KGL63_05930 [Betaproteobacteria bacterium]|nr:hypothetical protein [Betaproteobacteria bacterium]
MNIDAVAAQLRSVAAIFNGSVAGAAAYANAVVDQTWLPLPAAYVIPDEEDAEPNESMTGTYQQVHERVSVIVVFPTLSAGGNQDLTDRRGQAAAAQLRSIRAAIFKALLNWRPDPDGIDTTEQIEARGMYYVGGRFPQEGAFDRARFFYQFTFGLDTLITDSDGWQPTGVPLTQVKATITDQDTGATLATANAQLP